MRAHVMPLREERRRHQRVRVHLLGRFMLPNGEEYPCQVINMSPGGAAFISSEVGERGDRVIAYVNEIGRIEGKITRHFSGGFAIQINATARKREKLASQLTWLANRHTLGLPEDRRHERIQPKVPTTVIQLPDGRSYKCRIIDMSISGAAVALDVRPAIGTQVTLGVMRAKVVRHFAEGIAVQFADVQDANTLVDRLTGGSDGSGVAMSA